MKFDLIEFVNQRSSLFRLSTHNSSLNKVSYIQAFVRDPDGYYIEFCSCESLESYLKDKMATHSTISSKNDWNLQLTSGMMKVDT